MEIIILAEILLFLIFKRTLRLFTLKPKEYLNIKITIYLSFTIYAPKAKAAQAQFKGFEFKSGYECLSYNY